MRRTVFWVLILVVALAGCAFAKADKMTAAAATPTSLAVATIDVDIGGRFAFTQTVAFARGPTREAAIARIDEMIAGPSPHAAGTLGTMAIANVEDQVGTAKMAAKTTDNDAMWTATVATARQAGKIALTSDSAQKTSDFVWTTRAPTWTTTPSIGTPVAVAAVQLLA